jgi:hypothetical protein
MDKGKYSDTECLCCNADCTNVSHIDMHHLSCFTMDDLQHHAQAEHRDTTATPPYVQSVPVCSFRSSHIRKACAVPLSVQATYIRR